MMAMKKNGGMTNALSVMRYTHAIGANPLASLFGEFIAEI